MTAALPDWAGLQVVVAGAGRTGASVVRALEPRGAQVRVVDDRDGSAAALPAGTQLVVTSPGWSPRHPLLLAAAAAGLQVWGDVELAWRLSRDHPARWLAVTGTNGKTTTTEMLGAILATAGDNATTAGNIGTPLLDAVLHQPAYAVLAVELSSFQLYWAPSVRPFAAAVLNVADDHLDWHGSPEAYADAKAGVLAGSSVAVAPAEDEGAQALLGRAPGRKLVVRRDSPGAGELGIVVDTEHQSLLVVDRAFGPGAPAEAELLAEVSAGSALAAPHNLTNALVAAALARAHGVPPAAVGEALRTYRPGAHRLQAVAERDGVLWVDDSKATNPHAALASLSAYPSVVWLAGGRNKGLRFDELVAASAPRLRAAVLLGEAAEEIAGAFARHAPQITLVRVPSMDDGVREAARLARPGDTVLLAPACASMDMFRDYADRGEQFTAAVRQVIDEPRG